MKHNLPQVIDILSDILLNSNYDEEAISKERNTILQEMEFVYHNSKEELIFDYLHETAFQNQALGYTILGPVENIKNINSQMLKDYIKSHYTGRRMVIVCAGSINHKEFVNLINKKFNFISSN